MAHARTQIRHAFQVALSGLPAVGANVFVSRALSLEQTSLPAILIYTQDEQSAAEAMGSNRPLMRGLQVIVDIVLQASAGFDDLVDNIAVDVEKAIHNNQPLMALLKELQLASTKMSVDGHEEQLTASLRLVYEVQYWTREADPETII